jgi:hypothetical protein
LRLNLVIDRPIGGQLLLGVRVPQGRFGEGEQQQPLLVGEEDVSQPDGVAELVVPEGVLTILVVLFLFVLAIGHAQGELVVGDAGAEAHDRVGERQGDFAARSQHHVGPGVGVDDLDRDRTTLVAQPPLLAAGPQPPEHAVEMAVVVDAQVAGPPEGELVAGLDRGDLAAVLDPESEVTLHRSSGRRR